MKIGNFMGKNNIGYKGIFRLIILTIIVLIEFILLCIGIKVASKLIGNIFIGLNEKRIYIEIVLAIIVFSICYFNYRKDGIVDKLTEEEEEEIKNNCVLVNYCNVLSNSKDSVYIKGNVSRAGNYSIKLSESNQPHIWFHKCPKDTEEPDINAFNTNHLLEQKRKYKIIIDPKDIDLSRTKIRRSDGSIVYEGNLEVNCKVDEEFVWGERVNLMDIYRQAPILDTYAMPLLLVDRIMRLVLDLFKI